MNKKAIYTVYLGKYDLEPKPVKFNGWDSVIVTDQKIYNRGWTKIIKVEATERPDVESRRYKWLSHIYLKEYDLVCYHDGNIKLRKEPPNHPFKLKHFTRSSVLEELQACNLQIHRCAPDTLNEEYEYFKKEGFADDVGLFLNGFFCRDHSPEENELCELVFDIVQKFTPRDQIALPYAIWKTKYKLPIILDSSTYMSMIRRNNHKILNPKIHNVNTNGIKPDISVHHITPGRSDKNLGKSINDIIRLLPDHDWICLRDIDTIPMYHEVFFEQCEKIAKANQFDLIGCVTNRLGLKYQLHKEEKSNETDIMHHREIAKELYQQHGSEVTLLNKPIGGLFMLFSKRTWSLAGGFPEGGIMIKNAFIDYHFCTAIQRKNLKIGLAKGIYLFHYYRLHHGTETSTKESKKHLIL